MISLGEIIIIQKYRGEDRTREAEKERKDAEEKTRRPEGVQAYYVAQSSDGIRCDHNHQTEAAAERCADELEIEHSLRKYGIVGALEHGLAAAEDESLREWKAVTVLRPQKKKQIKGVKT